MTNSTNLGLPYIAASQAQKHATHNEAVRLLDGIVQLMVLSRTLTAPPGSPADGDRYIVGTGATGAWAGWDLNVAFWVDGAWIRLIPRVGWIAYSSADTAFYSWNGTAWVAMSGGALTFTGDVTGSGTGTIALTIAAGAVTLAKQANLAANRIIGNNTGSAAVPLALTATQVKTMLAVSLTTDVSGTLQAAQEPAHTGDVTNAAGSLALTLATVNGNVGTFGSASLVPVVTVNAKGLITAVATVAVSGGGSLSQGKLTARAQGLGVY